MRAVWYLAAVVVVLCMAGCARHSSFAIFLSDTKRNCVTLVKRSQPQRYIGYRIVEFEPEITDSAMGDYADQPRRLGCPPSSVPCPLEARPAVPNWPYTGEWLTEYEDDRRYFQSCDNGIAYFRYKENEGLYRIVVLKAVDDGVDVWAWLESEKQITGSFVVQACFRFSGVADDIKWRHKIALVPQFSEYDLWKAGDIRSLTYVRQKDSWHKVRAGKEHVNFWTEAAQGQLKKQGISIDEDFIVPYGLIVRESSDGSSIAAMYWERTVRVTNHQPADCLHSFLDLGPAGPGKKNVVHGKLYWFEGTKDDLLEHWNRNFPDR